MSRNERIRTPEHRSLVLLGALLAMSAAASATPAPSDSLTRPPFALVGSEPLQARHGVPGVRLANPHGDIAIPCEACHTPDAWTPLRDSIAFDHGEQTRFAMTGKHALADCAACHLDLKFDQPDLTADQCASCHLDVHRGQLGDACQTCHNTQDFHLINGALIHVQTAFPLTGSHLQITCESCHAEDADGLFAPLETDCFTCHAADYQSAASIDHVAAGFSTDCETCHSTLAFSAGGGFNHVVASNGFALVGTHATIECAACHTVPGFEPTFDAAGQDDCFACHEADFEQTTSIDHVAAGFPTDCAQCHSVTVWEGATFEHAAIANGFALIGAHAPLACASCHVGPDFEVPDDPAGQNDCVACHAPEHEDEHPSFPTDCLQCHTVDTWDDADFEHAVVSEGFELVGAHTTLDCAACHIGPDFDPIFDPSGQNNCFACHAEEHDDEHPTFPTDCLQCHTVDTWDDADFDHAAMSEGFSLIGAHETLPCESCHVGPDYEVIFDPAGQDDCVACHAPEHEQAHPAFPTDCAQCHTVNTWDGADFDHAAVTEGFSLVGAHEVLPCASCHVGPDFDVIFDAAGQNDCVACHTEDHAQEHPDFPTDCLQCHTVNTWDGAEFEHDPYFPIYSGKHAGEWDSCQTCHNQGTFEAFTCLVCHEHSRSEMDDEHEDVGGYVYESNACLACHPDGEDLGWGMQK